MIILGIILSNTSGILTLHYGKSYWPTSISWNFPEDSQHRSQLGICLVMGIYKKQTWWGYNGNIVETSWDINPGFSQARMNKQNPVHENMKVNHLQWKLSRIYVPWRLLRIGDPLWKSIVFSRNTSWHDPKFQRFTIIFPLFQGCWKPFPVDDDRRVHDHPIYIHISTDIMIYELGFSLQTIQYLQEVSTEVSGCFHHQTWWYHGVIRWI